MDYQRSTGQQSSNHYDQVQRIPTSSSDRKTVPSSSSRRPIEQRPTGRYGQYQRPTEDSSRSQSSDYLAQRRQPGQPSANQYGQRSSFNQSGRRTDSYSSTDRYGQYQRTAGSPNRSSSSGYSSQRRPTGQPSANQYGQRPSSNPTNQSDRRSEPYASSRRPVEQRPDDRYGQYQRPTQKRNQRQTAQQSVNPPDRNASAYSPFRSTDEQRPVDHGQYQRSTQESRPRATTQSNKSSVSNPDSKKISEKHYVDKINRKFPMKTIIIGVAALLVLSVFVVIRMKRDDSSISMPIEVPGEAEVTYNYIDDDKIAKKELIGTELDFKDNSVASGTMKYRFKSVTAYDNLYTLCGEKLKNNIDNPSFFKLDQGALGYDFPDDGSKVYDGYSNHPQLPNGSYLYVYDYPDIFDRETGLLKNHCHIFVFEIELINIDAKSDVDNFTIKSSNEFNISGILNLVNRSGEKPYYGKPCYFEEAPDSNSYGLSYHVVINPGETKIIHLGYFLLGDESEHPYSRMGLADEGHTSTYDDSTIFLWFDMSDVISKEKE
ncbi:MAG: hypothetical protein II453_09120 [Alphaproteobacteria bacterium]|nr:hypothetical protein [Alphaproteobacteria bacterium]